MVINFVCGKFVAYGSSCKTAVIRCTEALEIGLFTYADETPVGYIAQYELGLRWLLNEELHKMADTLGVVFDFEVIKVEGFLLRNGGGRLKTIKNSRSPFYLVLLEQDEDIREEIWNECGIELIGSRPAPSKIDPLDVPLKYHYPEWRSWFVFSEKAYRKIKPYLERNRDGD